MWISVYGGFCLESMHMYMPTVCCVISSQTLGNSRNKIIIIFISLVLLPPPPLHFLLFHYLVHWNIETLYCYYRFIPGHSAFTKKLDGKYIGCCWQLWQTFFDKKQRDNDTTEIYYYTFLGTPNKMIVVIIITIIITITILLAKPDRRVVCNLFSLHFQRIDCRYTYIQQQMNIEAD